MAKLLKLRRGTTSQHNTFTGAEGEVTIDTTKDTAVVHDGSTAGGTPLAKEDMSNVSSSSIAGRLGADSIATTKIAGGALPTDVTVASANIVNGTIATDDIGGGQITSAKIADGTIVNADVNASAAIDGTKISPNFGSQNITTTGTIASNNITITDDQPFISLQDTDNENDFEVGNAGGTFRVRDVDSGVNRLTISSSGIAGFDGNLDVSSGVDVTGNITVTGTVDGRDVAADGTKLDGIESGATSDQTAAEIRTLVESASDSNVFTDADHSKLNGIESGATADQSASEILTAVKTVDGSGSGLDADQLDGQHGSYYQNASNLNAGTVPAARLSTASTQSAGNNSTKIATTAYVETAVSNLVDSSPGALNTLNELAAAINDDASFSTTVNNNIATKMPKSGGEFTGNVTCENITPDGDSSRNLGSNSVRFANVYADNFVGGGGNLTGIVSFVSGMIIMYNSTTPPSGWYLCNGQNGTPDLRDRFIVGAGNSYSQNATGGSNTATDTVSISGSDTVNISVSVSGNTGTPSQSYTHKSGWNKSGASTSITSHTHSFSGSGSGSDTVNISGSDTVSIDTRSPYYALTFIMKA